jgi:hypothetical protein
MPTEQITALQALLEETERAHGAYEATELQGVYDEDWPQWYARYAVDHGLAELVGRAVSVTDLAGFLTASWEETKGSETKPGEPWDAYTARRIAKEFQAARRGG